MRFLNLPSQELHFHVRAELVFAVGLAAFLHGTPAWAEETTRESNVSIRGLGLVAPAYADPVVTDAHDIGPGGQVGVGARLDGRFHPAAWLGVGAGIDYLTSTIGDTPSRHVAIPVIISVTPLRLRRFELGFAIAVGPAWSWYSRAYSSDGERLHGVGIMAEARLEPVVPITHSVAIAGTLGARIYEASFENATSYAAVGPAESPAAALDVGLGARLSL
jgi:hypothetical protein